MYIQSRIIYMRFAGFLSSIVWLGIKKLRIFFNFLLLIRVHGAFLHEPHFMRMLLEGNQFIREKLRGQNTSKN